MGRRNSLGLTYPHHESLGGVTVHWALENLISTRAFASMRSGHFLGRSDNAAAFLAKIIETEKDPALLKMMAQNLGELGTPETASRIAAMAGRTDLPMEIREEFVMALGTIKSEEAAHILDSLSNSREAGLGEAARLAKAMRNPQEPASF